MIWSYNDLELALEQKISIPLYKSGNKLEFNSSMVEKDDIFIALKGKRDGHEYVQDALDKGASFAIVSHNSLGIDSCKILLVPDTFLALQKMAKYKREKSEATFIGITGSSGKTTSKEFLNDTLSIFGKTFSSRGNFNNLLGVLINLASMPNDIKYAVLEMGMNSKGEIDELTKLVKPDIAVITTISEAHLEFFPSILDIVDAKCEIFNSMSSDGSALINIDNQYYKNVIKNISKSLVKNILTFGTSRNANICLVSYKIKKNQLYLEYRVNNVFFNFNTNIISKHQAINYANTLGIIYCLNLDLKQIKLHSLPILLGRGKILDIEYKGKKNKVICDYYNANPESCRAGLEYLKIFPFKKKTIIIGDMLELGIKSKELHIALVPFIIKSGAKKVFCVGHYTKFIINLLPKFIVKEYFLTVESLILDLPRLIEEEEMIFIKGSRGINLDKIINQFQFRT